MQAAHHSPKEVPALAPGAGEQPLTLLSEGHLPRSPERAQVSHVLLLVVRYPGRWVGRGRTRENAKQVTPLIGSPTWWGGANYTLRAKALETCTLIL